MKKIRVSLRLMRINFVLLKHRVDNIVLSIPLFAPIKFLSYLNPWIWFYRDLNPRGERICHALEELGPIFVKFGQLLSTRGDLLPDDIAMALEKLQDQVTPFSGELAIAIIEETYGKKIHEIFAEFDPIPLASASVAQVHAVKLFNGKEAVIKIIRPGIASVIQQDVDLLMTLAKIANRYWSHAKRVHPIEIVQEFEYVIFKELDLIAEGANASQLSRNFKDSSILHIPEIYWDYSRENLLVMEKINGIPITDMNALKNAAIDLKKLAERGVEIFFTQVFRDSFFHADMHAGNIFVNPNKPDDPQYIAVDFGIVGTLTPEDQYYLAANFMAFFNRDYQKVARLHIESGWVPATTRVDEFASSIRAVCEPIFEKPLKEISFGRALLRLFQTGRRFNMKVQPQLLLLQKTLLNIEGLGLRLYPDLDLWQTAKPYLEKSIYGQSGIRLAGKKIFENLPDWINKFPEMPHLIYQALKNPSIKVISKKRNKSRKSKKITNVFLGIALGLLIGIMLSLFNSGGHMQLKEIYFVTWEILIIVFLVVIALLYK
jgi:ubiquinone biosynthesis protein